MVLTGGNGRRKSGPREYSRERAANTHVSRRCSVNKKHDGVAKY